MLGPSLDTASTASPSWDAVATWISPSDDVVKDCVVDEILDQLFDQSGIAAHQCWLNVRVDVNLAVLGLLAVGLKNVTGDCGEVEGFGVIEAALSFG